MMKCIPNFLEIYLKFKNPAPKIRLWGNRVSCQYLYNKFTSMQLKHREAK